MKKRLFILNMIYSAGALVFFFLFIFYMYLVSLLAEGEIGPLVMVAAVGGVFAAGKAMCQPMTRLGNIINRLERASKKTEREQAEQYELRIERDFRPKDVEET